MSISHSFSTPNNPRLKNEDKFFSKIRLPRACKFNRISLILLLIFLCILPIEISQYLQISSHQQLSLQDTSKSRTVNPHTPSEPVPSHSEHHRIRKPISDPNEYRHITLPNGLKVLMISSPIVQRSYTALTLEAGFFIDPPEIPGLAHLLEHVLSAGSKTFNEEISHKGIIRGAWITHHETVHYSDGKSSEFERTLEMLADSFINPRFDSEWYEHEIHLIDKEFNIRLGERSMKSSMLLRCFVDQESLLARDIIGNYETLHETPIQKGINISKALQELFEKHYSANLMTLTVLHYKPLDEIQRIVTQSQFSKIPNKNLTKPNLDHFPLPLSDKNRHKILKYPSYLSQAVMAFQVCGVQSKLGAVNFIIDILERDSPGSLSNELFKRKLIDQRVDPRYYAINSDCGIFEIEFKLDWSSRSRSEGIVQTVYAYIHKLIHEGLTQDLSSEYFNMKDYLFQYSEFPFIDSLRNSQVNYFFEDFFRYAQEDIFGPFELSDDALLAQAKSILLQMNTHNLMLRCPVGYQDQDSGFDESKIYDPVTKMGYLIETLPEDLIQKWNTTTGENYPTFKFLRENPFVPKNFTLIKKGFPVKKISNNIWYGAPSNLKVPKVAFYLKFPGLNSLEDLFFFKLLDSNLGLKYLKTTTLEMNQITEAGNFLVLADQYLGVSAFSDSLAKILDVLSPIETNFNQSADFLLKSPDEQTLDDLLTFSHLSDPLKEANNLLSEIMVHHRCTSADKIKKNIAHRFSEFFKSPDREMFNSLFANPEFLIYGSISPQDAITMVDRLTAKIPNNIDSTSPIQKPLDISKHNLVYRANFNTLFQQEAFVLNYYQGALFNIKDLYYQRIFLYTFHEFIQNSSLNQDVQITTDIFIKGDKMGFSISGLSSQDLYDQNQIDLLLEKIVDDFYKATRTFSQETTDKIVQELPPSFNKFPSFGEQADGIFSWIDTQIFDYIGSEDFFESLEDKINVKEYLEYVDAFFANCGKISLQGFSQKNFSKEPLLQEKDQLIMKKQPVIINSTDELQGLFAIQMKNRIIE